MTALFRKLGAPNPESWASSQISEGIHQLHRFLFLREAWKSVISESDETWIDGFIQHGKKNPTAPYAGVGHVLERMLEKKVDRQDIIDLVRGVQASTVFDMCLLLESPEFDEPELEETGWSLVEVAIDEDCEIEFTENIIGALHESVLSLEPHGARDAPAGQRSIIIC